MAKQHKRAIPVNFKQGDTVMIQQPERKSKFSPKFVGPYRIVRYVYGNKFEVMEPNTSVTIVIHSYQLKNMPSCSDSPLAAYRVPVNRSDTRREQLTQASHTYNLGQDTNFSCKLHDIMFRLLILLVTFVGGLLAFTPIHLKPGALTNHLCEINLIEDVQTVQYPYAPLLSTTSTIKVVSETLFNLSESVNTTRITGSKVNSNSHAKKILILLRNKLIFLHGKIDQENTDYSLHPIHSRVKRGLLNIFGTTSKYIFGTATEDEIHDLREHYNHILSYAVHNRRVINLNYRKIGILQSHLKKLLEHTNKLTSIVNKALQRLTLLTDLLLMDQTLHVLDAVLTSVLSVHDKIIANKIDTVDGWVTPSLFPLHDLIKIISIGHRNYSFQPLYSSDMSQHYYPLLEASLTTDAIAVHVPFTSTEVINAFEIVPFPFSVEDSVLTLDMSS